MPRKKGSGQAGPVRALRLPRPLDAWFEGRLRERPAASATSLLLELVHGGLRLVPGYMSRQRAHLERLRSEPGKEAARGYLSALRDTFGDEYVAHLEAWIEAAHLSQVVNNNAP